MQGVIGFIKVLLIAMVLSCAITSLLMELHVVPRIVAARTGTLISETQQPKTLKIEKTDIGGYPDFWYVDKVRC